jgi:hypothetical protein
MEAIDNILWLRKLISLDLFEKFTRAQTLTVSSRFLHSV